MLRLRWMFVAAAASLLMVIMGTVYVFEVQNIVRLRNLVEKRSAERDEIKRRVEKRREEIEFYTTEAGIAHLSREKHGLILPGEKVYMIVGVSADVVYSP
jgi:cell division protein FtsB